MGIRTAYPTFETQRELAEPLAREPVPSREEQLRDLLESFLRPGRRHFNRSFTVGLSAVNILDDDPTRVEAWVFNLGTATIFLGGDPNLTTGPSDDGHAGFPLLSNTGVIIDDDIGEFWAISGTAGQDVRVMIKLADQSRQLY